MGCWSERCALTGLEISAGDAAYLAVIDPRFDTYDGHMILVPPVKGTYDDYGGLVLTEDVPLLGMRAGAAYTPAEDGETVVFFNAQVFEAIEKLQPESTFTSPTVGHEVDQGLTKLRTGVEDLRSQDLDPAILAMKLERHFSWPPEWRSAASKLVELIEQGDDLEPFYLLARRVKLMKSAEQELRRPISPIRVGPQHGGEAAQRQISKLALDILEGHRRERDDWQYAVPGGFFDQPFSLEQDETGAVKIADAEGKEFMTIPVPVPEYDNLDAYGPARTKAFAEWMVARLNAPATEISA